MHGHACCFVGSVHVVSSSLIYKETTETEMYVSCTNLPVVYDSMLVLTKHEHRPRLLCPHVISHLLILCKMIKGSGIQYYIWLA